MQTVHLGSAIRFYALVSILAASNVFVRAADSSETPKSFSAYIGGFMGGSFFVELKDGKLLYRKIMGDRQKGPTVVIKPTPKQWAKFRATLDAIPLWVWKAEYMTKDVDDGTQWNIDIVWDDHNLTIRGDNSYPEKSGKPNNKPEYTAPFRAWLAAVKELIGGRDFD